MAELPIEASFKTGGTTGFSTGKPSHNNSPLITLAWNQPHQINAIAFVSALKPTSVLIREPEALPNKIFFEFYAGNKLSYKHTFPIKLKNAQKDISLLPYYSEIPTIIADTLVIKNQNPQKIPFALSEVYCFSQNWNIAPIAQAFSLTSVEGVPGYSVNYINDEQTPLGLPQKVEPHKYAGFRSEPMTTAHENVTINIEWHYPKTIDEIRLFPVERLLGVGTPTAGFPRSLDIEYKDKETREWNTAYTHRGDPIDSPGLNPVSFRTPRFSTTEIRITVDQHWKQTARSAAQLALAEIELRLQGKVHTGDFRVHVSSELSGDARPGTGGFSLTWSRHALMDRMSSNGKILPERTWIKQLSQRRELLAAQRSPQSGISHNTSQSKSSMLAINSWLF